MLVDRSTHENDQQAKAVNPALISDQMSDTVDTVAHQTPPTSETPAAGHHLDAAAAARNQPETADAPLR
ncbi:hypothetical protein D3C86_1834490 [compost metagenome]